MLNRILIFAILAVSLQAGAALRAGTVYTWTDEEGVRHMTDRPPPEGGVEVETYRFETPAGLAVYPEKATRRETPITVLDGQVLLPARVDNRGRTLRVMLLLDTGATHLTLHRRIARDLLVRREKSQQLMVAGGSELETGVGRLDAVSVGPNTRRNVEVNIIEHNGPEVPFDGLLGMDFLRHYQYSIDFEREVLVWR